MPLPEELRSILVCPDCHGSLEDEPETLRCIECGLQYPIREGLPIMLVEEARRQEEPDG